MVEPITLKTDSQKAVLGLAGPVQSAALTEYGFHGIRPVSAASHRRLNVQYRYSPIKSHKSCLRYAIPKRQIVYDSKGISGLRLCSSSTCQYCANKKHLEVSEKLTNIISNTKRRHGWFLLTLTCSTSCSIFKQVHVLKSAYDTWIDSVRKYARRNGEDIAVSWAFDATFDLATGKHHLHKLAIVRTNKDSRLDWEDRLFRLWRSAVRGAGGGDVVRKAFYFEKVETEGKAASYLFKAAKESLVSQSKSMGFGERVGFNGLADAILKASSGSNPCRKYSLDSLVEMYRSFILAVKGSKWFVLPKKMKDDFLEPTPEEDVLAIVGEEEEEDRITPMKPSPHFHRAVADSGYLWLLYLVLRTKKDGDIEVEMLRYLVEKYSSYDEEYWKTESNYLRCIEEVALWGSDFE